MKRTLVVVDPTADEFGDYNWLVVSAKNGGSEALRGLSIATANAAVYLK